MINAEEMRKSMQEKTKAEYDKFMVNVEALLENHAKSKATATSVVIGCNNSLVCNLAADTLRSLGYHITVKISSGVGDERHSKDTCSYYLTISW